jgi:YD repeat-containing protein
VPDAVGNLYRKPDRSDRKYGAGGRLLEAGGTKYHYDDEGNIGARTEDDSKVWLYKWNANGSLKEVVRPDHRTVKFEYDALGRRTAKTYDGRVTRWVWYGNMPLHEWIYDEKDRPKAVTDEFGFESKDKEELVENVITWVFEEGTFKPAAKLTGDKRYSIITDYLGTPAQMYDEHGMLAWETRATLRVALIDNTESHRVRKTLADFREYSMLRLTMAEIRTVAKSLPAIPENSAK